MVPLHTCRWRWFREIC